MEGVLENIFIVFIEGWCVFYDEIWIVYLFVENGFRVDFVFYVY